MALSDLFWEARKAVHPHLIFYEGE